MGSISFNRSIKPANTVGNPVLIIFSDGSTEAYGAAAYARWQLQDKSYESRLITAKNRIAPIKTMDIVRLELAGAVVGKRLRSFIKTEMRIKFDKIYHIIDSEIVKAMISKESYGFNTFAANRIGEIQETTEASEWFWVKGTLNIADWLTRGKLPTNLDSESIWQKGPQFIELPEEEWPIISQTKIDNLPERSKTSFVATVSIKRIDTLAQRINISRFSNLELLRNTTARILKLYRRFRTHNHSWSAEITPGDREEANTFWIEDAQREMKKEINTKVYVKLCPKLKDNIVVVGGRTERWMASTWNRQEFVLLPFEHRFAFLISEKEHQLGGHLGVAATIARIRLRYWIIGIRKLVKRVVADCVICRKKFKRLSTQVMGQLPIERIKPSPPFSATGIDFFGPYIIKGEVQKRVRGKCYGVIFTCMVSRAVYVDISLDYSTDAFLQVLRRFTSTRGWPNTIFSDNGSQLVAASKELRDTVKGLDWCVLQRYSVKYNTEWKFSPADGPWFNGATEALVKTVKRALNAAIGEQIMSFSELQTILLRLLKL